MPQPLDQAYLWSINPQTGMDPSGNLALGSLIPTSRLNAAPKPTPLNPQIPTPGFSPAASNYFNWTPQEAASVQTNVQQDPPGAKGFMQLQAKTYQPGGPKPYFDPNYPNESMLALRDYLAPQVQEGADAGLRARGLQSTGVGQYAQQSALDYLNTITGSNTPQAALLSDLSRLYGPNAANSLTQSHFGQGPGVPGAQPIGDGTSNMGLEFIKNPDYTNQLGPAYNSGGSQVFDSLRPQFGMYDYNSNNYYVTPGYSYDPESQPDVANMPWLGGASGPGTTPLPNRYRPI